MRRKAFSLLELIIVLTIIGLLVGLLLPALLRVSARARDVECCKNMNQMNTAMNNLLSRQRKLPDPASPLRAGGWAIEILPYLEEIGLWQQLKDSPRIDSLAGNGINPYRPRIMTCPDASDSSSSIASVPISHYTMRVIISRTSRDYAGFSDVALSSRSPWIQSPENASTPSGGGPHDHGYFNSSGHFFGD
jgi:prepilin-type N-terminal cleavage/methylation domain-containing protein